MFFVVNVFLNIALFVFFTIPAYALCGACVVGMIQATTLNPQMKVILINMLAAELISLLALSISYLGYIPRFHDDDGTCKFLYALFVTSGLAKLTCNTLYAIMVKIFITYRSDKLKWLVIVPCI